MRRKKNKKIDIYTALMLPLMTMFLLNIGLVATTWAWYTARISSGVNSIKAEATESTVYIFPQTSSSGVTNVSAVSSNEAIQEGPDGFYTLEAGTTYSVTIKNYGSSATGYHCVFTIMNMSENEIGRFYTPNFKPSFNFSISQQVGVKIKVETLWGSHDKGEKIVTNESSYVLTYSESLLNIKTQSSFALRQAENLENITKFSYSIRFYDQNTKQEIKAGISSETEQEVIELKDYLVDGYELVEAEDYEIVDGVMYLFINPEIESNVFNIYYNQSIISQGAESEQNEGNQALEVNAFEQGQSTTLPEGNQPTTGTETIPISETGETSEGNVEASGTSGVGDVQTETPTEEKPEVDAYAQS